MIARALGPAIVLAAATATHAETFRCEFSGGVINSGVFNSATKRWAWMSPRTPVEFFKGLKPGVPFWFTTATYTRGERFGTLAGSAVAPVTETRSVEVSFAERAVSFVDITPSGSVLTLTVTTERDRDGRLSAAFSRHTSTSGMLLVSQYWGSCQ
jgi:hypothetical protein